MANVFEKKVCVVTGAASGIGLALSTRLAAAGAMVILADRDGDGANAAAAKLSSLGGHAEAAHLDVTDAERFARVIDDVVGSQGRIDYLFNNAGIGIGGEARDFGLNEWRRVIDVDLYGTIHGIDAVYRKMIRQGSGHIVNVASVAGLIPFAGEISYTASKYAVVGLSHTLRAEAADLGVRVSVVCPGKIETPIYATSPIINFDREKALALWPKGITADECARRILRGVERNQGTIVITRMAGLLWAISRVSSNLSILIMRQYMRRLRRYRLSDSNGRT